MIEAQFEYKCRRCGGIYRNPCCSPAIARQLLTELTITGHSARAPVGGGIYLYVTHRCDDGGEGLADLQGYRVVDTEA